MNNILEKIEENPELKAKIEELDKNPETTPQDFISAAAEYGLELTEADFQPISSTGELTDDELDAVAGGDWCACTIGGGGSAGGVCNYDKTCACVLGGGGEYKDGETRCVCVLGGSGTSI